MKRYPRLLCVSLAAWAALLMFNNPSEARPRGYGRRGFPPNRMPGWDAWRIYPWSPYNYGRNPYNPAWYPSPYSYPYSYPYPVYNPAPPAGYAGDVGYGSAPYGTADSSAQAMEPDVSGPVSGPPADAALIRLYVPARWADVWFDGVKTDSIGRVRYYVTPDLDGDKPFQYDVRARWNRDGQPVTRERRISVSRGQTVVVDFTRENQPKLAPRERAEFNSENP